MLMINAFFSLLRFSSSGLHISFVYSEKMVSKESLEMKLNRRALRKISKTALTSFRRAKAKAELKNTEAFWLCNFLRKIFFDAADLANPKKYAASLIFFGEPDFK